MKMWMSAAWIALLLGNGAVTAPISAQGRPNIVRRVPERSDSLPQVLITSFSGGISLGAYQAGVNWAILEALRTGAHDSVFRTTHRLREIRFGSAAGASAGNINALLWAIEACMSAPPSRGPAASLFWQTWMPVGIDSLLRGAWQEGEELAVLDRRFFNTVQVMVEKRMESSEFQVPCTIPVGITLTRVVPDIITVKGDLAVRTQRFVTAMVGRSQARGEIRAAEATPPAGFEFYPLPATAAANNRLGRVRLPSRDSISAVHPDNIFKIVRASSAFPVAFAPVELRMYDPRERRDTSELFMDGGIFDNNPIDLANLLEDWREHPELPKLAPDESKSRRLLLYVDPDVRRRPRDNPPQQPLAGGFRPVLQMLGGGGQQRT